MGGNLYNEWLSAFASIGVSAISRDTAARILSVVYVHGNNEALVYNTKFLADIEHIKRMYHIDGGETPDMELTALLRKYIGELENYREFHNDDNDGSTAVFRNKAPEWARKLFEEKYGIKLIN